LEIQLNHIAHSIYLIMKFIYSIKLFSLVKKKMCQVNTVVLIPWHAPAWELLEMCSKHENCGYG